VPSFTGGEDIPSYGDYFNPTSFGSSFSPPDEFSKFNGGTVSPPSTLSGLSGGSQSTPGQQSSGDDHRHRQHHKQDKSDNMGDRPSQHKKGSTAASDPVL
jgi:hypothetical protein